MARIEIIGPDILEGHGDFAIDADPYFTYAANWAVSGGTANHTAGVSDSFQTTTIYNPIIGSTWEIKYTVTAAAGGGFFFTFGGITGGSRTIPGTFTETIITTSTARFLMFATINCVGSIDNLTIRRIIFKNTKRENLSLSGKLSL